jgi:hypothetical protein
VPLPSSLARQLGRAGNKTIEWRSKRDELIVTAHGEGGALREIASLVGLTNPAVLAIIRRTRGAGINSGVVTAPLSTSVGAADNS